MTIFINYDEKYILVQVTTIKKVKVIVNAIT